MKKTVFEGTDGEIKLIIVDTKTTSDEFPNGTPIEFIANGVSKMELCVNSQTFSSDTDALSFDSGGVIKMKLGKESGIAKNIAHSASLTVFDPLHLAGQVVIHPKLKYANLTIEVVSVCA